MTNYEIMILTNTEMPESNLSKLLTSTLNVKDVKLVKLDRNELVYPIKKQTRANYYVVNLKVKPELIAELTRKFNIEKLILRYLIINLDTEKGMKPKKPSRFNKYHKFNKSSQSNNPNKQVNRNPETKDASNATTEKPNKDSSESVKKQTKEAAVEKKNAKKTTKSKKDE